MKKNNYVKAYDYLFKLFDKLNNHQDYKYFIILEITRLIFHSKIQ